MRTYSDEYLNLWCRFYTLHKIARYGITVESFLLDPQRIRAELGSGAYRPLMESQVRAVANIHTPRYRMGVVKAQQAARLRQQYHGMASRVAVAATPLLVSPVTEPALDLVERLRNHAAI